MTETRRNAQAELTRELRALQGDLATAWVDRSLPEGWDGLDSRDPLPVLKEKVTLRLDADMMRWFRKLGPGYGRRINRVLRIYWMSLLAGRIKSHWDEPEVAPAFLDLVEKLARGPRTDED
ncbi:MAG: BrnA antitoxin family protein [Paracoccaceae bacterium]